MSGGQLVSERSIALSRAAAFRLGTMDVSPPTRELKREGAVETLEPRVMQVLVALYRSIGTVVSRDDLISSCWDGRVVGDNAIQRTISRLREVSEGIGSGCFRLETVNKVGYRLLEIEYASAVRTNRSPSSVPAASKAAGPWSRMNDIVTRRGNLITGVALLALVAGLVPFLWHPLAIVTRLPLERTGRITVAPFEFHHGDSALAELAQNLEETIKRHLAEASLAPVSVSKQSQADNTNAEFEIGGSVGRASAKVFVDVWVEDLVGGVRAWSTRLSRTREKADGLDESIGDEVAQDIKQTIDLRKSASRPLTAEQLAALLNANDAVTQVTDREREATARLVQLAPDFAAAHALRAVALADYDETIDNFASEERAISRDARASASRAIAMDPNSTIAWLALGRRLGSDPRFQERENALRRSMAIEPGFDAARFRYTVLLREVGRLAAAHEIAYRLDNPSIPHLAFLFAMAGDWPEASHIMDHIDSISPREGALTRWTTAVWWGDPRRITPEVWRLGYTWGNAGLTQCFKDYVRTLIAANGKSLRGLPSTCTALSDSALPTDWRIRLLAREGDVDGAYAELDRAPLPNSRSGTMFLFYPEMRAVRADPRFLELTDHFGLRSYWLRTKQWPDFCKDEAPNRACTGIEAMRGKGPRFRS